MRLSSCIALFELSDCYALFHAIQIQQLSSSLIPTFAMPTSYDTRCCEAFCYRPQFNRATGS